MYYKVNNYIAKRLTFLKGGKILFIEKTEKILKDRKLTWNKLSKACDFPQSSTTRYKNGTLPSAEVLIKICRYLNVSADYLLDLDEEAPPPITNQERELIEAFRECDSGTQKSILMLARSGAEEKQAQEKLLNSKIG